jgi:hypothetical protein
MTTKAKKYLKIFIGSILIVGKMLDPHPFWSWSNAEGVGYNIGTIAMFSIGLWLLYSAGHTK